MRRPMRFSCLRCWPCWRGRLWWYVPLATLLLLTREGYVVYAFAIFLVTVCSRLGWNDKQGNRGPLTEFSWKDVGGYWKPAVLTAIPGIVTLAWTAYLTIHFQMSPIKARGNPDATNWPYYMMVRYIKIFYRDGNWFELRLLLVSTFTLVLVSVLLVKNYRKLPLALVCTLPYVLLTAALGKMVWEAYGGHTKASGAIIIIGLFMLPIDKSLLLRFMLAFQAIVGLDVQADIRVMHPRILSPYLIHEESGYEPNPPGRRTMRCSTICGARSNGSTRRKWLQMEYHGIWMPTQRELRPITVAVTNHTDVTWQPGRGKHPIWLGYILTNSAGDRQLASHSIIIDKPIAPGETKRVHDSVGAVAGKLRLQRRVFTAAGRTGLVHAHRSQLRRQVPVPRRVTGQRRKSHAQATSNDLKRNSRVRSRTRSFRTRSIAIATWPPSR